MNKKISNDDLCPNREAGVSDLDAYLNIRKEKENIRASHVHHDPPVQSRLIENRIENDGRKITVDLNSLYG